MIKVRNLQICSASYPIKLMKHFTSTDEDRQGHWSLPWSPGLRVPNTVKKIIRHAKKWEGGPRQEKSQSTERAHNSQPEAGTWRCQGPHFLGVMTSVSTRNWPNSSIACCLCLSSDQNYLDLQTTVGFLGGPVVKNLPANTGDTGSIPESGRSPGEGNGDPLQCSCLGNPKDRGAWRATVHGVAKSRTWLSTHVDTE